MGLPTTVLGIPGYLVSRDPWDPMPGGTTRDSLGIPGYLVSRDPWDPMPGGTTRDSPGYPRILSTMGMILGCPMYPGMSRVVLGQAVAVLDIPLNIYVTCMINAPRPFPSISASYKTWMVGRPQRREGYT